jgi:hypothetical protein
MKNSILYIVGIALSILSLVFFIEAHWGYGIGSLSLLAIYCFILFKSQRSVDSQQNESVNVAGICPHCKNPNVKRIEICEWCGNQII